MIARLQIWAAAAAMFIIALAASWFGGRKAAQADIKADRAERRLQTVKEARDVADEIEALDRDTLNARARVWVRGVNR